WWATPSSSPGRPARRRRPSYVVSRRWSPDTPTPRRTPPARSCDPSVKAVTVKVTGRVQGVSFRWYTVREAERLGVTGWVRNEPDGSVAAHLEGEDSALDAMGQGVGCG